MAKLRIIPLGGLGEVGKNMTAFEFGDDIVVVDCGSIFPRADMLGIDLVIPDITYLERNRERVRAYLFTHGHEDHIGATPYVLPRVPAPVYGTKLTCALIRGKLAEHNIGNIQFHIVKPKDVIQAGAFSVQFIKVSHSIAGAVAMALTCPAGTVIVTGDFKIDYTPIDGEVTDLITNLAEETKILFEKNIDGLVHTHLIGSPIHLKRILINILTNAVKYNKEYGHIYLSCRELPADEPGKIKIEFLCRDTGIGMSEEFQRHLFEPFAQEKQGCTSKFGGTGLGMSIAKSLTEKMGGTLTFESKQGIGTTMIATLLFKIDEYEDKWEVNKDVPKDSIKGFHILLVEDNELNMEIAEFVLQNEGAVVTKAWNGQKAVDIFRKNRPGEFDAILMDIMMPVMNGYEAAKMIRSLDREDAKVIPIIAMTANAFTEDKMRAKEAGMDEHIAKPVDGKLLVKVINELVKRDQREKL